MREHNITSKRRHGHLVALLVFFSLAACQNPQTKSEPASQRTPKSTERSEGLERSRTILFFGNSITAGYQLNPSDAFPALIQHRLDSLGYSSYEVINAGISGETSSDGLARIDWTLKQPVDIFVLELGGNDGLRGLELAETRKNLSEILSRVTASYPEASLVVAGMEIPPNMGPDYSAEFRALFPYLAAQHQAVLIPFLLEHVAGEPAFNLPDGIHPTEEGHRLVAETVWKFLQPLLLEDSSL